ncbi:hypothetical protein WMY93_027962 [Mugilogobius chulae]|uniref:Uncharacterized protein n=1 Tax=Mugilogobius chulae TaxID=88201 RepID=A0AAW0N6U0_9GOBI
MEEQRQEVKKALDQAEVVQVELREEREMSREQVQALTAMFTEKEEVVCSLESIIAKYEIDKKTIKTDFLAVKDAVANMEQAMKEQMDHLLHTLHQKEVENQMCLKLLNASGTEPRTTRGHPDHEGILKKGLEEAEIWLRGTRRRRETKHCVRL